MRKVLVIGGGISGLTVAYWLYKSGLDVTLLEKEDRAGGSIRTEKDSGYLIECGPNSTLDLYNEVDDLCESLDLSEEKIYGNEGAKNRYVVRDGRLRPLPMGPLQFLSTDLWTIKGKLRLMCEPFIRKSNDSREESIAEFVIRRTGLEFLDYAIDPFVTGVFAGDPYQLSLKSCFPKMYGLEQDYGGLVKGALFGRKEKGEPRRKMRLFSFRDGLDILPVALCKVLGNRFVGGCNVLSVKKADSGFEIIAEAANTPIPLGTELNSVPETRTKIPSLSGRGWVIKADAVILATPSWATAKIIHPMTEYVAAHLSQIKYVPIVIVFTGFDRKHISHKLDGFGFLIPSKEAIAKGYNILGSIWSSATFPRRAPEGKAAFTNMLGGARMSDVPEHSDSELVDMTLQDLRLILGIKEKPDFVSVIRHTRAIPQYTIGHQERIDRVGKALKNIPGLYLTGNYITGISVGHCITEATKLAKSILTPNNPPLIKGD
ncbi:MAG: protoporphyrinogen oxidase [Nitrospirae bacterium]|nr:protoporphyrinogen oxidase [Nitrospirota bacterium]